MYNNRIAEMILQKYGKDSLIIYCKIECFKSKMIDDELREIQGYQPSDFNYDAEWWNNKYKELTNDINH
jgi:hypothetical protein